VVDKKDYYELLGISKGANTEEIKAAYRKQAIRYHPDRNPNDKSAEGQFKQINEAYEVLSDAQKRAAYNDDRFGHAGINGSAGGHAGDGSGGFSDMGGVNVNLGDILGPSEGGSKHLPLHPSMRTILLFATAIATLSFLFFLGPLIVHSSDHWLLTPAVGLGFIDWFLLHQRFPRCSLVFGAAFVVLTLFLGSLLYLPFP